VKKLVLLYSGETFAEKLVLHGEQKMLSSENKRLPTEGGELTETWAILEDDNQQFEVQMWGLDWDGMRQKPILCRRFTKFMSGHEIDVAELPPQVEVDFFRQLVN